MPPPTLPESVTVVEVGPRDGLQNEPHPIPTDAKAAYVRGLAAAGCRRIEVTSFVHPDRVPQLADAEALLSELGEPPEGTTYSALVPNERGLDRALRSGVRGIAVFTAASDSFVRKNLGMDRAGSLRQFEAIVRTARDAGLTVRGYVSTAFDCPYEGEIPPEAVLEVSEALLDMGVDELSLGDTIGVAVPGDVYLRLERWLTRLPAARLAMHFHDTSGTALANVLAALEMGISTFDSSAGGLGGCPFAPGATGNLATEDLLYMLERMGIDTGISLPGVAAASAAIEPHLGHPLPSRQFQRLRSIGEV
jgi:hydroxymethylglutaryl-CoA lyase